MTLVRDMTTGEAALIAKISQQTIIRLCDSGRLPFYRIPGSRFRRINREALLKFLTDSGMPHGEVTESD